jgi:lysophospholipase L1-like esterase
LFDVNSVEKGAHMVRRKRNGISIGKGLWFVSLVFLAFIATLAYQAIFQPATNNPLRYASGNLYRPGRKVVVCTGGDFVRGQISFNFVNYLAQKPEMQELQFINDGINSDLAYNLLQRLEPVIACRPAYIVIQIGTNDLLGSIYPKFGTYYKWTKRLPRKPDLSWYSQNLVLIIEMLKQRTKAKIALVELPMLGEAIHSVANREVEMYNQSIKKIAAEQKVRFIPIYNQQVRYLLRSERISVPEYEGEYKQIGQSLVEHLVFKKSLDDIAFKNGYLLHTDGIHLNSRGGIITADQVERFLKNI